MEKIIVTTRSQQDADKLLKLLRESELVESVNIVHEEKAEYGAKPKRQLTPQDMVAYAFGIGEKPSYDQVTEYLNRPIDKEGWKPLEQVVEEIKANLKESREKKK